jgi:hypothetical protein
LPCLPAKIQALPALVSAFEGYVRSMLFWALRLLLR